VDSLLSHRAASRVRGGFERVHTGPPGSYATGVRWTLCKTRATSADANDLLSRQATFRVRRQSKDEEKTMLHWNSVRGHRADELKAPKTQRTSIQDLSAVGEELSEEHLRFVSGGVTSLAAGSGECTNCHDEGVVK
jgi:hypothetical protein